MSELISKTTEVIKDYGTYQDVITTTVVREITHNIELLTEEINNYLANNEIGEELYKLTKLSISQLPKMSYMDLERYYIDADGKEHTIWIDEDFDDDDSFISFIEDINSRYKIDLNVPGNYYGK